LVDIFYPPNFGCFEENGVFQQLTLTRTKYDLRVKFFGKRDSVGAVVGVLIGVLVGTFGFLVMRNPMRLALLSWQKGYYQRMVLDTTMRIQLRVLGVLGCLFGTSILTASLGSALRLNLFSVVSEGLWVLMGLIFFKAWGVGLVLAIRQLIRGELFNWFRFIS
jgi:hypothetical protein